MPSFPPREHGQIYSLGSQMLFSYTTWDLNRLLLIDPRCDCVQSALPGCVPRKKAKQNLFKLNEINYKLNYCLYHDFSSDSPLGFAYFAVSQ